MNHSITAAPPGRESGDDLQGRAAPFDDGDEPVVGGDRRDRARSPLRRRRALGVAPRGRRRRVDALAVAEVDGLLGGDGDDGQRPARGIRGAHDRRGDVVPLERAGLVDPERADARAAQRREVPAGAELGAEVARERAHVGARRALDAHVDVEEAVARPHREQLERRHGDRAGRQLDLLAVAHPLVGALAVDLHGAHRARHLVDHADLPQHARPDRLLGRAREALGGCRGERLALGVVGRGVPAEPDRGEVLLVEPDEVVQQPRGVVHAEDEEARRHRVERARVPDLAGAGEAAHARDDVVAGDSLRLVDEEDAAVHAVQANSRAGSRPPPTAADRRSPASTLGG